MHKKDNIKLYFRGKPWKPVFPIRSESNEVQEKTNGKYLCAGTLSTRNQSGQAQWDKSTTLISNAIDANYFKGMDNHGQQTMIISDSGQGRKSQLQNEIIAPLRANTGTGHNNVIVQRTPLKFMGRNQKNFDDGDYAFTVDSCNTGGIKVNSQIRRLTPLECERLQGYPDGWTEGISDTQRYKCLGNAVTVNVIEAIVYRMRENIARV